MTELGFDVAVIDAEYDEALLYKGKSEEQIIKIKAKRRGRDG